mgnify:CR=1 FL=1
MKPYLFSLAATGALLFAFAAKAQNLDEFNYLGYPYQGESYLSVAGSYSRLKNNAAPNPDIHNQAGWTIYLDYKEADFTQGKMRYTLKYKLLGDMIFLVDAALDDSREILREKESTISNGLLGWHSFIFNINGSSPQSFGIGFHLNDYFLGSTVTDANAVTANTRVSLEPQGYYWTAGPSASYVLRPIPFLIVEGSASYSFPYWRSNSLSYAEKDHSYPKPHFGVLSLEVMTSVGVFAGLDYTFINNRGDIPNNTQRFDALIGFRFML